MSSIFKRIFVGVCISLVMMCVHKPSHAAGYSWSGSQHAGSGATPSAACASVIANIHNPIFVFLKIVSIDDTHADCYQQNTADKSYGVIDRLIRVGAAPICTAGTVVNFSQQTATMNPNKFGGYKSQRPIPSDDSGCALSNVTPIDCYSRGESDTMPYSLYCDFTGIQTGQSVSYHDAFSPPDGPTIPRNSPMGDPTNQGCPAGTSNVGTDAAGGGICSGGGTSPIVPDKTTGTGAVTSTTNPDGSTTTKGTTSNSNTDGSTTTNTTTCTTGTDGGKTCTTSQNTGNTPSGNAGKSDGNPDENKNDLCKLHPELNVCKNSQVTGAACSGSGVGSACTGDAIQCAILRQQQLEYCGNAVPNKLTQVGQAAIDGTDNVQDPFKNATTVNVSMFDTSDSIRGVCPAPAVVALPMGGSFNIPFDAICGFAAILKPILIAVAAFTALIFVYGGV
ncbi:hypothetical protein LT85_2537 [Collimonas arenae]|uniref:Uncharacterized protein n=1 Tax=Collimonas arenae TaxID=279058 RepID=A0A0A1FD41_9BURK|nr:virulence factor TspB C-terminal domain-related protein [Collimonas arenae]AIY41695.1 hypothetical protein LT85_2537 [Collimonas arenae]